MHTGKNTECPQKSCLPNIYYIISTYLDITDFCKALRNIFLSNIKFLACYPPDRGDTCELRCKHCPGTALSAEKCGTGVPPAAARPS